MTVDLHGAARDLGGLVDGEPLAAGQVMRVVTTGGGGWGDPLEREPERVALDVLQRKVSPEAARRDYGVVLAGGLAEAGGELRVDEPATARLRAELRAKRTAPLPLVNRGPGYETMTRQGTQPKRKA